MDVKNVLIFLGGVVVGGGATYLYLDKRFNDRLDREVEDVKSYYAAKNADEQVEEAEELNEEVEPSNLTLENIPKDKASCDIPEEEKAEYEKLLKKTDYAKKAAKKKSPKKKEEILEKEPYIIDADTYYEKKSKYDKRVLTYYEKDDVFVEDDENIVKDGYIIVGKENMDPINFKEYDSTIYVRNEDLKTDFEVIFEDEETFLNDDRED